MGYTSAAVRKCFHIEIRTRFDLIHLFAKDMVYPERHIISGRIGTNRK
jgi:hypothetical protein